MGRVARQGDLGSHIMLLNVKELEKFKITSNMVNNYQN